MTRRQFVYSTGAVITASVVGSHFLPGVREESGHQRPNPVLFKEPILQAIAFGINAPNPHNTQAWKFELLSANSAYFYIDEQRILPFTDPSTRQIHIGCGCFFECLRLGMKTLGYDTQIGLFPQGECSLRDIGKKPIATITVEKNERIVWEDISQQISKRRTSRLKYKNEKVPTAVYKQLLATTAAQHTEIELIDEANDLAKAKNFCIEAMQIETATFRTHDESRIWFRENDDLIAEKRDGINLPGGGTTGLIKWIAELQFRNLDRKKWHDPKMRKQFLKSYRKTVEETPSLVYFKTKNNRPLDWIQTGRDYIRFQLSCSANGVSIHPMSQVLQEYEEMGSLRTAFDQLMKIEGSEKIQMLVRMGYSKEVFYSYRRKVEDFMVGSKSNT